MSLFVVSLTFCMRTIICSKVHTTGLDKDISCLIGKRRSVNNN